MTLAPRSAAHCSPRNAISDDPAPAPLSTFPINTLFTPLAIPIRLLSTSRPKIVPQQCVPCPLSSSPPPPVKFS